jgi:hypothetical protein
MLELLQHDADFGRGQRPVLGQEGCDRRRTDLVGRIPHLLAVHDCEAKDLLDDVADVDGGRRCAPVLHLGAQCAQVIGHDLDEQAVLPRRNDIAVEDRSAHGAGAVRHRRLLEPALAEFSEVPGFLDTPLFALLLPRWRLTLGDQAARL